MIKLTKDNTATPVAYSVNTGVTPVTVPLTLDGTGDPVSIESVSTEPVYVWANDDTGFIGTYTSISLTISGSDTGVTWLLSLDGSTNWASSINVSNIDVNSTYQTTRVYAKASALNNGSVITNNYVTANILLAATENPIA